jgi:hypothetical protein
MMTQNGLNDSDVRLHRQERSGVQCRPWSCADAEPNDAINERG